MARFGGACWVCPLSASCTSSQAGRTITIHNHEARLAAARQRQRDLAWRADYCAHRPTVERKLAHLLRRRHGGRRAACGADCGSPRTGGCLPQRSTSPASPPWAYTIDPAAGRSCPPSNQPRTSKVLPTSGTTGQSPPTSPSAAMISRRSNPIGHQRPRSVLGRRQSGGCNRALRAPCRAARSSASTTAWLPSVHPHIGLTLPTKAAMAINSPPSPGLPGRGV